MLTQKEKITANCFLSQESVDLLKIYLATLQKKNNTYLFSSNGKSHLSDEAISKMLNRLAEKAQINLNGKSLSFHCFRKMFLSTSIDSGIGLTAGKKLCGKAIPKSDDTYLTTVKLKEKFIQLKKFLTIKQSTKSENQQLEKLGSLVAKLAEELEQQKIIAQVVTGENLKIRREFKEQVAQLNEEIAATRLAENKSRRLVKVLRGGRWRRVRLKLRFRVL